MWDLADADMGRLQFGRCCEMDLRLEMKSQNDDSNGRVDTAVASSQLAAGLVTSRCADVLAAWQVVHRNGAQHKYAS